jgi:molybdopterin-biosynthesis enzyme MoeA-like protein
MAIGLIIVGDEILSGKRKDAHFSRVVELLSARGLQLGWAQYLGDDRAMITATLKRTLAGEDLVFSCGGIGATPDDHTRQCAAAALGVPLALHPEAKVLIQERIMEMAQKDGHEPDLASPAHLQRLKLGEFPQNAAIVPNPFNKIPGFSVRNLSGSCKHYFVPGFPVMAWPMIEWALDTHHADLFHQASWLEKSVLVFEAMESTLTPLMEEIEQEFAGVKVFSLPSVGGNGIRRHIELGVKGPPEAVEAAYVRMIEALQALNAPYDPVIPIEKPHAE